MGTLLGGNGDDSFQGTADADLFAGGDGFDTISYASAAGGVALILDLDGDGAVGTAGWALGDTVTGVEGFIGSAFDDTVRAFALSPEIAVTGPFVLDGGDGNDNLTGSFTDDHLLGGTGNDILDSQGGFDTLDGGTGFDIATFVYTGPGGVPLPALQIDLRITTAQEIRPGEFIVLQSIEGIDLVATQVASDPLRTLSVIGDAVGNFLRSGTTAVLQGNEGDDTLVGFGHGDGGEGNDILAMNDNVGGAGDDIYAFNTARFVSGFAYTITELADGGNDTVIIVRSASLTEWANIENLILADGFGALNAGGNAAANRLTGNTAANLLSGEGGADTLDGGAGADTMVGGKGADTYLVDQAGDRVQEDASSGLDSVIAAIDYTLGANLERLELTGTAVAGMGNGLANRLTGNALDNLLNGMDGADTLIGGLGHDTLIGGLGVDSLVGGAGRDLLKGGAGPDVLTGGAGADIFAWDSVSDGRETLTDFQSGIDRLQVSAAGFGGGLAAGMSIAATGRFVANATGRAEAGFGQFVLDTSLGELWWDANGTALGGRAKIAWIGTAALAAEDFIVVA